jgi:hypothetical protein
MHQQIRTRLARSEIRDGSGAMARVPDEQDPEEVDEAALDALLDLLAGEGYNLCLAGGSAIEGGGEFVFAIDHDEGDERTAECAAFLQTKDYRGTRLVTPHVAWLEDRPGALRDALRELRDQSRDVREIFVGTPKDGRILVHVTTVRRRARADT